MDVRCQQCATEYEFDDDRLAQGPVTVKCASCGSVFKVGAEDLSDPARASSSSSGKPRGGMWMVRQPNGNIFTFKELTTLQKWIVERKVTRDDEISKSGETWKRLGNIAELASFFQAVDQVAPSAVPVQPAAAPPPPPQAPAGMPMPPHTPLPPGMPPQPYPPPGAPYPGYPPQAYGYPPGYPPPGYPPGTYPPTYAQPYPQPDPNMGQPVTGGGGFAGNALMVSPQRGGSQALEGPLLDADDPVLAWQRSRRRSRMWVFVVLLLLAAGGGAVFLTQTPEGLALLEQAKLRTGLGVPSSARTAVEDAVAQALAGSPASLEQCLMGTQQALAQAPALGTALAVRSICMALLGLGHGDAHRENAALAEMEKDAARKSALLAAAERERASETDLSRQAFEAARKALQAAPEQPWANLAVAAYYVARRAPADARSYLERARQPTFTEPLLAVFTAEHKVLEAPPAARAAALGELGSVADRFPQARVARWRYAAWLAEASDPTALEVLDRLLKEDPEHQRALALQKYLAARGITAAAADAGVAAPPDAGTKATKPREEPRAMTYDRALAAAHRYRERGSCNRAMGMYMKAIELEPDRAEPHVGLGWCFLDGDKSAAAQGEFGRALEINASFAEAYLGLGEVYKFRGSQERAIKNYQKYLSILPDGPEADVARNALRNLGAAP